MATAVGRALALAAALCVAAPAVPVLAQGTVQGRVHTDTLWAQSLGIRKALAVYLPPSYQSSGARRYPVLVYLHGMYGNERDWTAAGNITRVLDSLAGAGAPEAIVVMPDGDDGWYTTWNLLVDAGACRADTVRREPAATYCVPWPHYDDYIARDIVAHVDRRYRTRATRRSRGIAGLSMGGYGAVSLALAYPDVFAAAASHSGVLSPRFLGPRPFAPPARYASDSAGLRAAAGGLWRFMAPAFGRDTIGWVARDPGRLAARLVRQGRRAPALMFDCGVGDPYIDQNRDLHATLQRLGVSHRFTEHPGAHDWTYWRAHVRESLAFLLGQVAGGS
ncbi:MAG: alpha/beta hydrolase-fold protein [Gemmatimonadota bacterium]